MSCRQRVLSLYRNLLRESNKFTTYNFRLYFVRRTKDAFRQNKSITDPKVIDELCNRAAKELATIRRQVLIGGLYRTNPLIIEHASP